MSRTPPLVARIGASTWLWVEDGVGWVTSGAGWVPVTDWAPVGGHVLRASEVLELVGRVGRPGRREEAA